MTDTATTLADRAATLADQAVALRAEKGYNCAQAVACALAPEVGADVDAVYRLSEGFGSGMGTTTETCGALSGAIMVLMMIFRPQGIVSSERRRYRIPSERQSATENKELSA